MVVVPAMAMAVLIGMRVLRCVVVVMIMVVVIVVMAVRMPG